MSDEHDIELGRYVVHVQDLVMARQDASFSPTIGQVTALTYFLDDSVMATVMWGRLEEASHRLYELERIQVEEVDE